MSGDVERDSHAYRLGVATEIIRWLTEDTPPPWMRQRAVEWLAEEAQRTKRREYSRED